MFQLVQTKLDGEERNGKKRNDFEFWHGKEIWWTDTITVMGITPAMIRANTVQDDYTQSCHESTIM